MNARQTLTTVTPPRSVSTQQVATHAPALKVTGSLVDSVRVSQFFPETSLNISIY